MATRRSLTSTRTSWLISAKLQRRMFESLLQPRRKRWRRDSDTTWSPRSDSSENFESARGQLLGPLRRRGPPLDCFVELPPSIVQLLTRQQRLLRSVTRGVELGIFQKSGQLCD